MDTNTNEIKPSSKTDFVRNDFRLNKEERKGYGKEKIICTPD